MELHVKMEAAAATTVVAKAMEAAVTVVAARRAVEADPEAHPGTTIVIRSLMTDARSTYRKMIYHFKR
ncbi:hypothetical protein D3C85_1844750 [compost metagenome]